uniref:Ultraviolet sensitive opsin n=1 Tax=Conwentzia psociformis TaxID=1323535 RepID=A0A1P8SFB4_9NEOP|nr:ultraviolet sensitive opsin [Conwentzia psociformis]
MFANLSVLQPSFYRSEDEKLRMLGWNVPQNELVHIPSHWLAYEEPPASVHFLLAIVYIGFTIAAWIGNGLVIWIFTSAKSLRTASNIFVLNLALCDFIMMLKAPIFIYNSFHRGFALGQLGCQIFATMGAFTGIGAAGTNACIAYDRYMTIAKPFDGKVTKPKAVFMVFCVWLYTVPWSIFPLMELWGRYAPEGYLTACSFDYLTNTFDNKLFVAAIFTFSYVLPMSMIIYYYSQIVVHVVRHERTLKEQAKKMNVESLRSGPQDKTSVEIRIAKAAITVCSLFVASWTPYAILALIGAFGDQKLLTPGITMIPALCCKLVACIDPYIYAISHPRYRVELNKRLPWLAISETITETSSTATGPAVELTSKPDADGEAGV